MWNNADVNGTRMTTAINSAEKILIVPFLEHLM